MLLHQPIFRDLVAQIMQGYFQPGDVLPIEPKLAEQFGVSRTVIREAIHLLVSKGLVVVRQGSGMRVTDPTQWNYLDPVILSEAVLSGHDDGLLEEVLEVRALLEVEIAGLAATRRSAAQLERLRNLVAAMHLASADPQNFTSLDVAFHNELLAAARNRLLGEALTPIAETIRQGRLISTTVSGGIARSLASHERILDAVVEKNAPQAKDEMAKHLEQFSENIKQALRQTSAGAPLKEAGKPL